VLQARRGSVGQRVGEFDKPRAHRRRKTGAARRPSRAVQRRRPDERPEQVRALPGGKPDYKYSPAVAAAGFDWDAEHLDKWLDDPRGFMPGTKMTFAGLHDPKDRIDLIAYLKVETGYKPPKG
jgi:hypothetical protein